MDSKKISYVANAQLLNTKYGLSSFLMLCPVNRKFVPPFSHVGTHLYSLVDQNAKVKWMKEVKQSFRIFEQKLGIPPVMELSCTERTFHIYTDA